jgi:protocadherin Fat 1/2/3
LCRYRFNFGSGEGIVTLDSVFVSDGEWHEISIERHGNGAKITVDRTHEAHGAAPGINDVLNLENTELFFGAQVIPNANGYDLQRGKLKSLLSFSAVITKSNFLIRFCWVSR